MKLQNIFLLITLVLMPQCLVVVSCLASNSEPLATQATLNSTTELNQAYQPPKRGVPGRREGAGTR